MAVYLTNSLSSAMLAPKCRRKRCRLRRSTSLPSLPAFWRAFSPAGVEPLVSSILSRNPNFKDVRARSTGEWAVLDEEDHLDDEDYAKLVVETCTTKVLPQALTLEHGLEALKYAIDELSLNPPTTSSGLIRIEVATPPTSKALNLFYSQLESPEVFPQIYISKDSENPTHQSANLNRSCGIYGLGAAVDFGKISAASMGNLRLFRRYLMAKPRNVTAYGFIGSNCNFESSFMKLDSGSFYLVIPQIELNEYEETSLLAGTIAWGEDSYVSFGEALSSFQICFTQARHPFSASLPCDSNFRKSMLEKIDVVDNELTQLVYLGSHSLCRGRRFAVPVEMEHASNSSHFCIKLSETTAFAANIEKYADKASFSPQNSPNINSLWASLIVEECFRLGLTYFCIAPGSRSSPLAVAAATHPHIDCIACYDERSLAYHAVGYARGSSVPAVVITTSGTAVSNLLPAVVEASQDFVPILLLTADRPPELHACGANQAINQLNHFGAYVRFFFSLPTPTDDIMARMVLTTIDSAVFHATTSPYGPVHINCAFREPLDDSPRSWLPSCLDKLDTWAASSKPFTKYLQLQPFVSCGSMGGLSTEVSRLIKSANCGLLLVGAVHTEAECWAALMLARHLEWPVVADILSGIRLRRLMTSYPKYNDVIFLDHFDHMLLCDEVREWAQPDVILQVGGRITSKRISQMLEQCFPCSYILVDNHPYRHDPSHIITHRIQSTIAQFADWLLKFLHPHDTSGGWAGALQSLETMVSLEISFQISAKCSLTEPYVANEVSRFLSSEVALFVGNSMVIRDMDMYCSGLVNCIGENPESLLPYQCIKVAGNRGASGIDGLLSTATGFAVGCKRRVLCVIGDISLLHDTNGLAILNLRMLRKPMTVIVINNRGGAIFSFLPVSKSTEPRILDDFFYGTHAISIRNLCAAHSENVEVNMEIVNNSNISGARDLHSYFHFIKHLPVKTKDELQEALLSTKQSGFDCLIEVESSIDTNAEFHSMLRKFADQTAAHAFSMLLRSGFNLCLGKVDQVKYSVYRLQLSAPLTTVVAGADGPASLYKQGFIIALSLDDGSTGYGEVAPFQAQEEDLQCLEEQLQYLIHTLKGAAISYHLPLLRGSFSTWIEKSLGIPVHFISPSVRCGLEMAVLNAIAARQQSNLFSIPHPSDYTEKGSECPSSIKICGLIDNKGSLKEVVDDSYKLVQEGFCALKLKVARRSDPKEDAAIVQAVRMKVGSNIDIRVDANRQWTYEQAIEFGSRIKGCDLQYIEEPVQNEDDILKFCERTGLPVALDETLDNIQGAVLDRLSRFSHPGIVAVVIKPSFVGGLENAALIARWAHLHGKMAVVSAAFESSLGLSCYVQFAHYLELQNKEVSRILGNKMAFSVAHGLGTFQWIKEDVSPNPLSICRNQVSGNVEASIKDADCFLRNFQINQDIIQRSVTEQKVRRYQLHVESNRFSHVFEVQEIGESADNHVLLFLHGYLGTSTDWIPVMKALSKSARCISLDLPGHGRSMFEPLAVHDASQEHRLSVDDIAVVLDKLISKIGRAQVTLVGYSMGARIALYMALKLSAKIRGAVIISGSPGLRETTDRKLRVVKDDSRASTLVSLGLKSFVESWYAEDLWLSLRGHPSFERLLARRLQHQDVKGLAEILSDLSIGRQIPLWEDLKKCKTPVMFVYGEKDEKFRKINREICSEMSKGGVSRDSYDVVEVPHAGHAVHVENPLSLIKLIRMFFTKIGDGSA